MNCPYCQGRKLVKNGHRQGKQSYLCCECGCKFRENPCPIGLSYDIKELYFRMSLNGMGLGAIERVTCISNNTVLNWVGLAATQIPEENLDRYPDTAQIDELQTFIGSKKNKIWVWSVVNSQIPGIFKFVIGDRSTLTFTIL